MLAKPNCSKRNCKHFLGVKNDTNEECNDVVVCTAFPDRIPEEIAYGDNQHTSPFPGDHGIQFEQES